MNEIAHSRMITTTASQGIPSITHTKCKHMLRSLILVYVCVIENVLGEYSITVLTNLLSAIGA
jgi:hypothetical protein